MTLRVALVGGPMYDHLYRVLDHVPGGVEVVVHADHPTLNRRVAELLAGGERIDVLATHSKYAPSQSAWLRPLGGLVDGEALAALAPPAVTLCRFGDDLLSVPRLVDVRVLWARADRVDEVPDTWADLVASDVVFGFPGRESGLFGTFFELVVAHGGRLFDDDARPTLAGLEAEHAVEVLCALARRAPDDLVGWHYDDVDAALLDGRLDAAAAWPGGWRPIRDSGLPLLPHPYPAGPARRVSYAGCHSWAVPTTCGDLDTALALLHTLIGAEAMAVDASGGTMVAHTAALAAAPPDGEVDRLRRAITRRTIDEAMITYPPLTRFPEVEDAGWAALHDALLDRCSPAEAVTTIQRVATQVLND